jgi:hypothetical protein
VGWLKFSDELRKVVDFFSVSVGGGLGSSSSSEKKAVEDVRPTLGLAPKWTGRSFAEVLRSDSTTVAKTMPIVGDGRSWLRASLATPCELDLLPVVRRAEAVPRLAVDCSSLEAHLLDLLDKDQSVRPQGKYSCLNFENLRLRTWRKLGPGFYLALGRAVRRVLTRFAGSGLFQKLLGFRVALHKRKLIVSCPPPSSPEKSTEVSSRLVLNRLPPGGLEVTALGAKEGASLASSAFVGVSSRSEPSSAANTGTVSGTEVSSGGESSKSQVFPAVSSRTPASNLFGFPPSPAPDLGFPADSAFVSFKFTPLGKLLIPKPLAAPSSLAGAANLGEKLRSPLPVVVS